MAVSETIIQMNYPNILFSVVLIALPQPKESIRHIDIPQRTLPKFAVTDDEDDRQYATIATTNCTNQLLPKYKRLGLFLGYSKYYTMYGLIKYKMMSSQE